MSNRRIIERAGRHAAIAISVLFIGLALCGTFGVWLLDRWATNVVLNGFRLVDSAVEVVDGGLRRVEDLIATTREEVQQASEANIAAGLRVEAKSRVLDALDKQIEARLQPAISQIEEALAPVRDAAKVIGDAVTVLNSVPALTERAPRLEALEEMFKQLEEAFKETTQLRGKLRTLAEMQEGELATEAVGALGEFTQRIDMRLVEVQQKIGGVQAEMAATQGRLNARKSQVLVAFNVLALLSTLMFAWLLYSQIVVIQHYREGAKR